MRRDVAAAASIPATRRRVALAIRGAVQGVGFRPHVWRLAHHLGLDGWVLNDARGVSIEAEGPEDRVRAFAARVRDEKPAPSRIDAFEETWLEPAGLSGFAIRRSESGGAASAAVLPDLAPCAACLREMRDARDRRHGYVFTNCTNCGPRFTIVRELPYDRPRTTMAAFPMCPDCRAEYENPRDRRFHAQPVACPVCGPALELWDRAGVVRARHGAALDRAVAALRSGAIVAVKGVGGFHLVVDAADEDAVALLRARKNRDEKPFALMVRDVAAARTICDVPEEAASLLASPEAPILLLPKRAGAGVAAAVAPGLACLGVMLPSSPLHHALLDRFDAPVVATSGNLAEEPICIDAREALARLGAVADLFLVHDRPIARHADDSVGRPVRGSVRLLRRARGFAPMPILAPRDLPPILAVGAHQKNTVALARGRNVFVSQHVGDLATSESLAAFETVIADFLRLYESDPVAIAHDRHPDYASTRWAEEHAAGRRLFSVQHHHAHLASCLADNGVEGDALGVTWDGTGWGEDGTIWGGEFLLGDARAFRRIARLRPFRLPGGDAAVRQPWRVALALLWEMEGESALSRGGALAAAATESERRLVARLLSSRVNAPVTTSAGRVFDAAAALCGLKARAGFEGQAAMLLEAAAGDRPSSPYPMPVVETGEGILELDWRPAIAALLDDLEAGATAGRAASRLHSTLAHAIVAVAGLAGCARVALTGGCFQNVRLTEETAELLERAGFTVLLHRQVPPNDGGISLGQAAVAAARLDAGA